MDSGGLERAVRTLLEQSAPPGRLLAPLLHLHGPGGWQHLTLNVGSREELEGSLSEARGVSRLENVDAFVCVLRGEHAQQLARGLGAGAGDSDELGYVAQSLGGAAGQTSGLEGVREALARLLLGGRGGAPAGRR
jgi:hypothetical protein